MLRDDGRPEVATKPTASLAEAILIALEDGYRGIQVVGRSGDGKSTASKYLCTHPQWMSKPTPTCSVSIPRRTNNTDAVFYKVIQKGFNLASHSRGAAIDRLSHIVDYIISECDRLEVRTFLLFVDEAHRMSKEDYDYLSNIVDGVNIAGYRLFCAFINQSDDKQGGRLARRCVAEDLPPQVVRRFFMAEHTFRGLAGVTEIADALGRYDLIEWQGVAYTEYFAPKAFKEGWRLASEAAKFSAAISELRKDCNLSGHNDLPMMIFELAVKRLLVHVAAGKEFFNGFSHDEIKSAIERAGYVKLERSRERQVLG